MGDINFVGGEWQSSGTTLCESALRLRRIPFFLSNQLAVFGATPNGRRSEAASWNTFGAIELVKKAVSFDSIKSGSGKRRKCVSKSGY